MNTDIITLTEIQGTDSVSSSRITINNNFKKLAKAVGDIQTRIDTSKNTIYINVIETESGEFAIKTTPNHSTRFKIDSAGNIYIGSISLDEYIRRVVNNTKFVELEIFDTDGDKMNFQNYSGSEGNDKANFVTVYYHEDNESFKVKFKIADDIKNLYFNAVVYVYGAEPILNAIQRDYYQEIPLSDFNGCEFLITSLNEQRTVAIHWMPGTAIQEVYSFTLEKIEE